MAVDRAPLRIGSRRTPLALAQTGLVVDALAAAHPDLTIDVVEIVSEGDRDPSVALGPGVFVAALREAVRAGRVDAAVHSMKDLPTGDTDDLVLAAVPFRADPRDVLVSRDGTVLDDLPRGARVGTSSPRRAAALSAMGLAPVAVRGSVGRRLQQLDEPDSGLDALLLARAGLARLGLADRVTETLDPGRLLPAAGQGALAVECRRDDAATHDLLAVLDDPLLRAAVDAERAVLATLEAGCTHPIGALAEAAEGDDGHTELYLRAVVHAVDGSSRVQMSTTGPLSEAAELGRSVAHALLDSGAADLMEQQ